MNSRILIAFLFISGFVNSQDSQNPILGEWFSCEKRDFSRGDTINLQRDSCTIKYENKGTDFSIQVRFEFAKDHFSIHKNSGVLGGGSYHHYWEIIDGTTILIGFDANEIIEQYEILRMNSHNLTLLKRE